MRQSISPIAPGRALLLVLLALAQGACGSSGAGDPTGGGSGGAPTGGGGASAGGADPGAGGALPFASGGSAGTPAPCRQTAESCNLSSDCCDGVCNAMAAAAELSGCHPRCTVNADCTTGCCLPYGGQTAGYCADAKWCSCGAEAARCGSMLPACCATQFCVGGDAQGTFFECRPRCTQNADCATSCCVAIGMTGNSACLDPVYCPK
jgi:hypothetical protein